MYTYDWYQGKQLILFPENLETKLNVSLGTSLYVICYIAGHFETKNSWNLAITAVVGRHSRVTEHC